jgi:hypothetical protein
MADDELKEPEEEKIQDLDLDSEEASEITERVKGGAAKIS